jgi:hypothetical protein
MAPWALVPIRNTIPDPVIRPRGASHRPLSINFLSAYSNNYYTSTTMTATKSSSGRQVSVLFVCLGNICAFPYPSQLQPTP